MSALFSPPRLSSAAAWRGLRVGVFGGSFNPPHAGHMHIAKAAMRRFDLDAVWWMVTPGNPLKVAHARQDTQERLAQVADMIVGEPKMVATDIECQMGTRYAIDTVMGLKAHFPQTEFIWVAGMDSAAHFHLWQDWQQLPLLMPFAFFDRPPETTKFMCGRVRNHKGFEHHYSYTGALHSGVYWVLDEKTLDISSSALRHK